MFQVQAIGIGIVDGIGAQQDARRIRRGYTAEIGTKDLYSYTKFMGQKSFGQVKFVNRFVATQLKSGENLA